MRRSVRYLLPVLALLGAAVAHAGQGKFYIVGMGTSKDLVTVRALEVIQSADIVLVETEGERAYWGDFIAGKEVWSRPIALRVMYGADPGKIADPKKRAKAEKGIRARRELLDRVTTAVREGKIVADLQGGDPMVHGLTFMLEELPGDIPTEVIPGVGAFQAASAAVKMSPPFGYDTSAVVLTMDDWEGRVDVNEKLMAAGSTLVVYTMLLDYARFFAQLQKYYPPDTPVAEVVDAGDRAGQKVIRSTVGRFLDEVDYANLPDERHILLVGKFLEVGQARKDFVPEISSGHAPLP
ncbi:MAG: hypothetical protein JXP48_01775 [Acidobacteria bacterium]|nr:hypothetical protein [Acidobacteriota bacterium]